jgi:hypothetical protein
MRAVGGISGPSAVKTGVSLSCGGGAKNLDSVMWSMWVFIFGIGFSYIWSRMPSTIGPCETPMLRRKRSPDCSASAYCPQTALLPPVG